MALNWKHIDPFPERHIGPDQADQQQMLKALGLSSLDQLIDQTVPRAIRMGGPLQLPAGKGEFELLEELRVIATQNQVFRSYIGMGYSDCITPPVVLRNILQNPGWYTAYTPYQAEVAQGRLEALLNFQTMVADLTGLEVANASLLDEGTAAAEAMAMLFSLAGRDLARPFFVSSACHPQTLEVVRTRAEPLGIKLQVGDHRELDFARVRPFGALVQYPATDGAIHDYRAFCQAAHQHEALVVMAADLLALTMLTPPGELGADVAVGSSQRFGVPLGYGGPHAAFFSTRAQYARTMPGRLIGVSEDVQGRPALRMALQTREQHIRREKATSNICTAQVLLAVISSMYAVYHGPHGLRRIAGRVHGLSLILSRGLERLGFKVAHRQFFDTVRVDLNPQTARHIAAAARARRINFRLIEGGSIGISLDEATHPPDVEDILTVFANGRALPFTLEELGRDIQSPLAAEHQRKSPYLTHPVFNAHHSETEMLRYIKQLEARDLSLCHSMIPLGSCTMKLNATSEMMPISWTQFARLHPFAPREQTGGYRTIFEQLEAMLAEITGFAAVSLQPNAGSQGEYAGLLVIREHQKARGQGHRDVCLIPSSAHGTNPASAVMAGLKVVVVKCDDHGNIDVADLEAKAEEHRQDLCALMVTYPSTHGVFEEEIKRICQVVHDRGGQVYMDGANMNAQVGVCRPGDIGADVCHLNLHKTFCIPHGGGGPGMGPIAVAAHLARFLPRHPEVAVGGEAGIGAVSAAPWGSASILLISWVYVSLMGSEGLTRATQVAMLNANYIAQKLDPHFPVLYRGKNGRVAHECIVDLRGLKKTAGVEVEDVAKRLMDYGFHAPTVSFPVAGTMMIEPTESESKAELDRFIEAMISIRAEIREIEEGKAPRDSNVVKNAPHTMQDIASTEWNRPYSREKAAFPTPWTRQAKFWPAVGRLNNALGDRKLICTCPPVESYAA